MNPGVMLTCVVAMLMPLMTAGIFGFVIKDHTLNGKVWEDWKAVHGKSYAPKEEMYRSFVFYTNLQKILDHNSKYPVTVGYTQGLNHFSDMTLEEYRSYNRLLPQTHRLKDTCGSTHVHETSSLPKSVDWRSKGYVTHVKNQGQCGSCWAFSTTGSTEGQHFKKTGKLLSLSEQQLVDCSTSQGNDGCEGGLMDNGFAYIMTQPGGLETEKAYPYTASDGQCSAEASKERARISGCVDVESGDEEALKHAVATVGPISVAIDASHDSFQSYSSGVYYEELCSSSQLDHGVLVVGYGTYQGQDYWLVKNSWDTDWGLNGYIMMARNMGNNCGIATSASYPTV